MNRKVLAVAVLSFLLASATMVAAQSLGDLARQERAKKPAKSPNARVYTNESLNLRNVPDEAASAVTDKSGTKGDAKSDAKDAKPGDAAPADDKKQEELRGQIAQQKQEITQLQREIDVAQREAKLRAAQYYGDAGAKLRDEKNYNQAAQKAQADIAAKQQALSSAQQKLAQLEEDARKSGVPATQK